MLIDHSNQNKHDAKRNLPFGRSTPRVLERCGSRVVVDKIANAIGCETHLPALGQRVLLDYTAVYK